MCIRDSDYRARSRSVRRSVEKLWVRLVLSMEPHRRRQGGRGRRLGGSRIAQLPWQDVTNPYAPMEVLSADQIEAIHLTSLRILEELGMEVMSERALALLAAAGAEVDAATHQVRLDRGLVENALRHACLLYTSRCV